MTVTTELATSAGHVKGARSVTVVHAPRYRGDRHPWVSESGTRYASPEVAQTSGTVPERVRPAVLAGGEAVRYEGSLTELHGTTWTAWGEPRHPGLLRLHGPNGERLRTVRPTSVVVI